MAAITSADGTVKIGSNTIGEVTGFSLEITSDTVESTAIDDTDRTYLPGLRQSTIKLMQTLTLRSAQVWQSLR